MQKPLTGGQKINLETLRRITEQLKRSETPSPAQRYVVLAHNHQYFRVWARQFGIAASKLIYVHDESSIKGLKDYALIVLSQSRLNLGLVQRIYEDASTVYDARHLYPVTENGNIVRWIPFKKDAEVDG